MAILGWGDYLCEACKHFDTDGNDGNHPLCRKQGGEPSKAVRLGEDCPFGYEFGIPSGYPVSMKRNESRAYEIKKKLDELKGGAE
jgi:hypothetical protein